MWALAQMGAARFSLPKITDIGFWKLLGSGTGEGFTPIPNTQVYAILATWPDLQTARSRTAEAKPFRKYRNWATETWTVFLSTLSVKGAWSASTPFKPDTAICGGPIAALTRATIKPRIALDFWRRVPDISSVVGADPNVIFKIGVGEIPWFHQVTFSIWPDENTMANFARRDGPHAKAIRAVREGNWFQEELYARFSIAGSEGSWGGTDPVSDYLSRNLEAAE